MVYAGVDVTKADRAIGAVDDRGEEQGKRMPFKNGAAGFERCGTWLEGVAETPAGVPVGMEATGHCRMASCAFLVSRGYSVAVVDPVQVSAVCRLKGLGRHQARRGRRGDADPVVRPPDGLPRRRAREDGARGARAARARRAARHHHTRGPVPDRGPRSSPRSAT